MSYIRLVNVTKQFGDVTAVNNLNLEIGKGESFSMLGPSGCGKTTTLRMVAGFEDLSDGEVWVGDRLLSSPKKHYYTPPENRNFGMVFQAFAVWPHMSVYENVAFPLRLRKLPKSEIDQRTRDALIATNLLKSAEDSPANLSGGGKQRVALARALAINPDVMLLDEPLSSLDPHLRTVFNLASRPTEIRFTSETDPNGVRGTVIRNAFLGEIIDYLVKIGDQEIRVQIGRRDPGPEVNEVCYLHFLRPFWYKVNE